ncbi:hypothetical protein PLEOSDRAFT_1109321 [Pleurotus ostreatus PC15]|uniref:Tyr recombinase domain-containing protein n=1 Tax=Pleurotus ostreatus (strain PC15) TaxID=1137138 RepID=A0A067N5E4_PLEO1|nr:hypothetical protein PLEOSDRAFT_1109321 [Pleurotus ostreatus PC15]
MSQQQQKDQDKEVDEEVLRLYLEEEDSLEDQIDVLVAESMEDFPEADDVDKEARYAASIARACITDNTRAGHIRIIKAYLTYHLRKDPKWDPKAVTARTPEDITHFITYKCGEKNEGCEGRRFSTAVSTRAALTYWYRTIRPDESITEWRQDPSSQKWYGLPTRSRRVADFMMGLEKMKARSGEISRSARALMLDDMHRLHDLCFDSINSTPAKLRWGIAVYLFAWLLMLRIEEVLRLEFNSIDMIPGEREYFDVYLRTCKSSQTGITHGWRLWMNDSDPKICPLRALIRLAVLYGDSSRLSGPLFLKIDVKGAVLHEGLSNQILGCALSSDMQALGYRTWSLFGTHSFRRGGSWGGWSQVEAITMFRYFYSPDDNHEHMADYDRNDKSIKY